MIENNNKYLMDDIGRVFLEKTVYLDKTSILGTYWS